MKSLNNKHRTVARIMALMPFTPIEEICQTYGLNPSTWRNIVSQPLFRAEVERLQGELEEQALAEASGDPILLKLKQASHKAADRLIEEIDNFELESGATSATRIKAASNILDRLGYNKVEKTEANVRIVEVSSEKLAAVKDIPEEIPEQPDTFRG